MHSGKKHAIGYCCFILAWTPFSFPFIVEQPSKPNPTNFDLSSPILLVNWIMDYAIASAFNLFISTNPMNSSFSSNVWVT